MCRYGEPKTINSNIEADSSTHMYLLPATSLMRGTTRATKSGPAPGPIVGSVVSDQGSMHDWSDRTWPVCSGTTRDLQQPPIDWPTHRLKLLSHKDGLETGDPRLETGEMEIISLPTVTSFDPSAKNRASGAQLYTLLCSLAAFA